MYGGIKPIDIYKTPYNCCDDLFVTTKHICAAMGGCESETTYTGKKKDHTIN